MSPKEVLGPHECMRHTEPRGHARSSKTSLHEALCVPEVHEGSDVSSRPPDMRFFVGAKNFLGLTAHARTPCKTYERMRPGNQTNHTRRSSRPRMGANAKGPRAKRTIGEEAPKGLAKDPQGQRVEQKAA